jgi:SAM-dependent methyltransferase
VPSTDWLAAYLEVLNDRYVRSKYDRQERMAEKQQYTDDYCPEVRKKMPGLVVDIGPGPGEWLEIVRHHGNHIYGVEAATGVGGMGNRYLQLSRLLHDRQDILCEYGGLEIYQRRLDSPSVEKSPSISFINFQGSWAQCFAQFVNGPPHHLHHDVRRQRWNFTAELEQEWIATFTILRRALLPGGRILIAANRLGPKTDHPKYAMKIKAAAKAAHLKLILDHADYVHKWQKTDAPS